MWTKLIGWAVAKWSSAAVSNILITVAFAVAFTGYAMYQSKNTCCKVCKAEQAGNELVADLADKLAEKYGEERDATIKRIMAGNDPCLDLNVDDILSPHD